MVVIRGRFPVSVISLRSKITAIRSDLTRKAPRHLTIALFYYCVSWPHRAC